MQYAIGGALARLTRALGAEGFACNAAGSAGENKKLSLSALSEANDKYPVFLRLKAIGNPTNNFRFSITFSGMILAPCFMGGFA